MPDQGWSVTITGTHPGSETMLRHYVQTLQLQGWVVQVVPSGAENVGIETRGGEQPTAVYAAVEGE